MKEIFTLQFGPAANYAGAHLWNLQDEAYERQYIEECSNTLGADDDDDEDREAQRRAQRNIPQVDGNIHFRQGLTQSGKPTVTPRLMVFDLKGSLGPVNPLSLYQEDHIDNTTSVEDTIATWDGSVSKHVTQPLARNAFLERLDREGEGGPAPYGDPNPDRHHDHDSMDQDNGDGDDDAKGETSDVDEDVDEELYNEAGEALEGKVEYWTEYLKTYLHPKTPVLINPVDCADALSGEFDIFTHGLAVMKPDRLEDEILDRFHFFAEDCDRLEGVHTLLDTYAGFGGLAHDLLQHIRDDYPKLPILTFAFETHIDSDKVASPLCTLNDVLSMYELSEYTTSYIPLTSDELSTGYKNTHLSPDFNQLYHTSALFGAAIDTVTLPSRLSEARVPLRQILSKVAVYSDMKFAHLHQALPLPFAPSSFTEETMSWTFRPRSWGLAKSVTGYQNHNLSSLSARLGDGRRPHSSSIVLRTPLSAGESARRLEDPLQIHVGARSSLATVHPVSMPVPLPYPQVFTGLTSHGIARGEGDNTRRPVIDTPTMAGISTSHAVGQVIADKVSTAEKINPRLYPSFELSGFARDEWQEAYESLRSAADLYEG